MKNHMIKYFTTAVLAVSAGAFSLLQAQIPNQHFEFWSSSTKELPQNWTLQGSVSKVAGNGSGFALKMTNTEDNSSSTAAQANLDDLGFYNSAFAYAATPDSITIVYRPLLGQDTTYIELGFTKQGELIAYEEIELIGNSGNWTSKTFPIAYISGTPSLVADSAFIAISSADGIFGPYSNGSIEIDAITFKFNNNSAAANIPNHSFENWTNSVIEYPTAWATQALYLESEGQFAGNTVKTNISHFGSAIRLSGIIVRDLELGTVDSLPGVALTIKPGVSVGNSDVFTPSFAINSRYKSIRGHIRSNMNLGDVAAVWVNIFEADSIVGSAIYMDGTDHASFFEFAENISWNPNFSGIPDSATVALLVSDSSFNTFNDSQSYAIFDDLSFDNYDASVSKNSKLKAGIYPNPSNGIASLKLNSESATGWNLSVYQLNGEMVSSAAGQAVAGHNYIPIDLTQLPKGIYILKVDSDGKTHTEKIIITQ
ncbi:MAG: T9SS type A sorting domain-containing protein [Bacteroidia bacterium]|nr:T9SS type A sorting domain-containing protein [Bacteroidia bacterium]